jgi:hypothetical protein
MGGPFFVRIVQLDGVERYLGVAGGRLAIRKAASTYQTVSSARRALRKYVTANSASLGRFHADIIDDNDVERRIEP